MSTVTATKTTKTAHWTKLLTSLNACNEAIGWAKTQPDAETAWQNCDRADWILWIAAKTADRKIVVFAACQCARYAQPPPVPSMPPPMPPIPPPVPPPLERRH